MTSLVIREFLLISVFQYRLAYLPLHKWIRNNIQELIRLEIDGFQAINSIRPISVYLTDIMADGIIGYPIRLRFNELLR